MDYANPIYTTHTVAGVDFTGAAAVDLKVAGPYGKKGRVVAASVVITTAVTVAASSLTVGTVADADAYATLVVPIGAANVVANNVTVLSNDDNLIPADSVVAVGNTGGSTAGVGTATVTIAWF